MRYFGGGIGHKATNKYTAPFRNDVLALAKGAVMQTDAVFVNLEIVEGEEALLAEEQDFGYELDDESEEEEDPSEEDDGRDLGAEDGEEPWEDGDDFHALGYDEL